MPSNIIRGLETVSER
ncbi:uncharacterized protein FFM5_07221 [Fusarium fujikuroi]|nr:uncharacterized protein FFM5_07221 [Fusarium fujikuroi]